MALKVHLVLKKPTTVKNDPFDEAGAVVVVVGVPLALAGLAQSQESENGHVIKGPELVRDLETGILETDIVEIVSVIVTIVIIVTEVADIATTKGKETCTKREVVHFFVMFLRTKIHKLLMKENDLK